MSLQYCPFKQSRVPLRQVLGPTKAFVHQGQRRNVPETGWPLRPSIVWPIPPALPDSILARNTFSKKGWREGRTRKVEDKNIGVSGSFMFYLRRFPFLNAVFWCTVNRLSNSLSFWSQDPGVFGQGGEGFGKFFAYVQDGTWIFSWKFPTVDRVP